MNYEPFALSLSKQGFRQAQPEREFIHHRVGSIARRRSPFAKKHVVRSCGIPSKKKGQLVAGLF
jgi:hypothetical protein